MNLFRVEQIDQVEIYILERYLAAKWYEKVLGFTVMKGFEQWAKEGGPVLISSDGGKTKIALFAGTPQGSQETIGIRRVAFRTSGEDFLKFWNNRNEVEIFEKDGSRLEDLKVVDLQKAFSVYFCDPYGNLLELTTYDHEFVREHL